MEKNIDYYLNLTSTIAGATENIAGKVIYGESKDGKYGVLTTGLAGEKWYGQGKIAGSQEGDFKGYSIQAKVGYVTDGGSNLYLTGKHARVNGVDYGTKIWEESSSSTSVQTSSQSLGTRTEDDTVNNVRKTIEDIRDTTTQTTHTTTTTHSLHSGYHGSRTHGVGVGAEFNTGNIRPRFEINYDHQKFADNTRQDSVTAQVGLVHHTSTGHHYLDISHTSGASRGTRVETGVHYHLNGNTSIGVFASHKFKEHHNMLGIQVRHAFGGSKSVPAPTTFNENTHAPISGQSYMVRDVFVEPSIAQDAMTDLRSQTKYFEKNSTASSTTTDVKTTHCDESKIVKTENLVPTISYDVVERRDEAGKYVNNQISIKYLLDD